MDTGFRGGSDAHGAQLRRGQRDTLLHLPRGTQYRRSASTTTTISDSNYFEPFHTTVLYVLGNVRRNGQTFYVTESRDTTIISRAQNKHVDHTWKLNDALHVVNRVSYLEIPLLMDAHLVQGPWALGLRGGPTIGVLSGCEAA